MIWRLPVPVAWLTLVHRPARLVLSIGGVAFAVILMFVELGFFNALYDSQTRIVDVLNADLIMMSSNKDATLPRLPFPRSRLAEARGFPNVVAACPLYMEFNGARWKHLVNDAPSHSRSAQANEFELLVFGFDPDDRVFRLPQIAAQAHLLKEPDTAMFDARSETFFGNPRVDEINELSHRRVRVVGVFPFGRDFVINGMALVSDQTFFKCFPSRQRGGSPSDEVELGLIQLAAGTNPSAEQKRMAGRFNGVSVLTKAQWANQIKRYWADTQPIGFVFGMGLSLGFLIGTAICYQILFNDVNDHAPQYATLKAIGHSEWRVLNLVVRQAIYLAVIGFAPGILFSILIYRVIESASGMVVRLTAERFAGVFLLTLCMCVVAALIAARNTVTADPAEVFEC